MVSRPEIHTGVLLKIRHLQNATPCGTVYGVVAKAQSALLALRDPEDERTRIPRNVGTYVTVEAE
jgi:hypothetical protein